MSLQGVPPSTRAEVRANRQARQQRRRRRIRRWTAGAVAAAVIALGLVVYTQLNANITREDVSAAVGTDRPTSAAESGESGPLNIMVMGSDVRTGEGNTGYGSGDWEPGSHSDTNLLVHLSADRSSAIIVSIPRDSMTPAPADCSPTQPVDQWSVAQWNRNYTAGGAGCVIRTFEGNTGIFVHHHVVIDFAGFKTMVDALGGVPVCTSEAIDDPKSGLELDPGWHTLDGEQALGYVRARYTLGDGSDLSRIGRQQAFLSSIAQKATATSLLLRPDRLYRFLDAATKSVTTDTDFSLNRMRVVAQSISSIGLDQVQFVTVPTGEYAPDPNRVEWTPDADALWQVIRSDRSLDDLGAPDTDAGEEPLTVSPANISVSVVNASGGDGLASQATEALSVQGFVAAVGVNTEPTHPTGVVVRYPAGLRDAALTVAAAFPGAQLEEQSDVAGTLDPTYGPITVVLGLGAANPVEVPNRVGSAPLPTMSRTAPPAPTPTITARVADEDICS